VATSEKVTLLHVVGAAGKTDGVLAVIVGAVTVSVIELDCVLTPSVTVTTAV
jgi:K+ transporter